MLWKVDVGQGFSAPVVARGRVILFHRREKQAIVESLEEDTGKRIWSAAYPTDYRDDFGFDEGPRAAPAVAGERIYTFGAEGVLQALDFSTGKRLWSVDTRQKFGAPKGFFGAACSPLVDDGRVLMNIGGPNGAGIGAFDAATSGTSTTSVLARSLWGDKLLLIRENGELIVAPATPKEFRPISRAQLLPATVRSYPALANGKLYVRNERTLACFDLR